MSYDLVFWTDHRPDRPDPQEIYLALIDEHTVPGLGRFDTRAALTELSQRFPGFVPTDGETGNAAWAASDEVSVEFTWSPQYLVATARGAYTNDILNTIVDVGLDVGGGRLYDPQTGERFDGD